MMLFEMRSNQRMCSYLALTAQVEGLSVIVRSCVLEVSSAGFRAVKDDRKDAYLIEIQLCAKSSV